jgi:hypothetical protein
VGFGAARLGLPTCFIEITGQSCAKYLTLILKTKPAIGKSITGTTVK